MTLQGTLMSTGDRSRVGVKREAPGGAGGSRKRMRSSSQSMRDVFNRNWRDIQQFLTTPRTL